MYHRQDVYQKIHYFKQGTQQRRIFQKIVYSLFYLKFFKKYIEIIKQNKKSMSPNIIKNDEVVSSKPFRMGPFR